MPGPGHSHVQEPALLVRIAGFEQGAGQQPVLAARDEHHRPLQPFGGVQGHQGDPVTAQKRVVDAALQGEELQKAAQTAFEFPGHAPQAIEGLLVLP